MGDVDTWKHRGRPRMLPRVDVTGDQERAGRNRVYYTLFLEREEREERERGVAKN